MIDPNEFVEVAEHILNTIVTIYGEHGVDLPARRYLAVGGQGETVRYRGLVLRKRRWTCSGAQPLLALDLPIRTDALCR